MNLKLIGIAVSVIGFGVSIAQDVITDRKLDIKITEKVTEVLKQTRD